MSSKICALRRHSEPVDAKFRRLLSVTYTFPMEAEIELLEIEADDAGACVYIAVDEDAEITTFMELEGQDIECS